jgi:hypothetical protein
LNTSVRKRVKTGDVLEVKSSRGYTYIQYVGKHAEYGDVIRVLPGIYDRSLPDVREIVESVGYLGFYSARAAVSQGLAMILGPFPLPSSTSVPINVRRAGARGPDGTVLTWIIEREGQEFVRENLTDSEKQLPIAAIWDHELLMLRVCEGWHPSKEG